MEGKLTKWMPKKNQWLIVLLVGLLLAVIALPTERNLGTKENYAIEEEVRLKNILEKIDGVGTVNVMITYQDSREEAVEGIVIITDKGDDSLIRRDIAEIVQALFEVDSHKIKVMKGNEEK